MQKGIIAKSLAHFESSSVKSFFKDLAMSKRKWCILFAYCPPKLNETDFFNEISNKISKSLNNYDNIVQVDDLNIGLSDPSKDTSNNLPDQLYDSNLKNLVKQSI